MADFLTPEASRLKAEARELLGAAELAWRSGDRARLPEALAACGRAMVILPAEESAAELAAAGENPFRAVWASAWLMRGRLLVAHDTPEAVVEGLRCFDQAVVRLGAELAVAGEAAKEELAVVWMNRGSALLRLGDPGALKEAGHSYEQAIALLDGQPVEFKNQNALGAAWMNRGVGLLRIGGEAEYAEALQSLDTAIATLEPLAGAQPDARRNLSSAWANRGLVRALQDDAAGAVADHRQAVATFRLLLQGGEVLMQLELAALLMNLGQAAGAAADTETAVEALREALALTIPSEATDIRAARLSLRTRHVLGVKLGGLAAAGRVGAGLQSERLAEASDLADEGLAVARTWEQRGRNLDGAGTRLFELGAWLYRTRQPQFLGEFLLEHVGDDPARMAIAGTAVQLARQAIVQRGFADVDAGGFARANLILSSLGEVETRLRAIASAAGADKPSGN